MNSSESDIDTIQPLSATRGKWTPPGGDIRSAVIFCLAGPAGNGHRANVTGTCAAFSLKHTILKRDYLDIDWAAERQRSHDAGWRSSCDDTDSASRPCGLPAKLGQEFPAPQQSNPSHDEPTIIPNRARRRSAFRRSGDVPGGYEFHETKNSPEERLGIG